nr:glucose-6-phosphate isomerase family protein [Methanofollis ethanolicus]
MTTPLADLWPGPLPVPAVRTADEMRCVLADPAAPCDGPLYFMYRDLALTPEDRTWLYEQGIRFDLTVIPPATLGGEYVKTKGHYHPENEAGVGYPEVYQVLAGEAHYLLQIKDLSDVVAVTARAGDVVLVPPGYGHVTINAGEEVLVMANLVSTRFESQSATQGGLETVVMANLVSTRFESEYGFYEERHGAAYYEMEGEGWVRNARYGTLPALRSVSAGDVPQTPVIHPEQPIYDLVTERKNLIFLNEPEIQIYGDCTSKRN